MLAGRLAALGVAVLAGVGCARLSGLVPGLGWGGQSEEPAAVAMPEIAAALRVALPLSLSAERFAAPENQAAIDHSLTALRDGAHELETHGRSLDESFAYLSRSLARDAEEIKRRYDAGRLDETRFLLGALVEDCVGCHSRLPSGADSRIGRTLFDSLDTTSLTPLEQARLEVATRQFEAALERYEDLLLAPESSPPQLDLEGVLDDYLTVAIRVRENLPRARSTLEAFAERPDLPSYLATLVQQWTDACEELAGAIGSAEPLAEAERVLDAAQVLGRYGRDRATLVHQLVASSLLLRYVAAHPEPSLDTAHAYFLLGVVELKSGRSFWLAEAESYLEAAIRTAPGSDWAKRAYVLLEEQTLASHSGSAGVHVPPDVRQRLRELREIAIGKTDG